MLQLGRIITVLYVVSSQVSTTRYSSGRYRHYTRLRKRRIQVMLKKKVTTRKERAVAGVLDVCSRQLSRARARKVTMNTTTVWLIL